MMEDIGGYPPYKNKRISPMTIPTDTTNVIKTTQGEI
jgi:hypothetical protein